MKKPFKSGRRTFLRGAGAVTLAIPFLPSLSTSTRAADPSARKFISYRTTNGSFGHQWYPNNDAITAGGGLNLVEANVREMMLRDIPGNISTLLDEQFDPFREKMVLMRHIDRMDKSDHQSFSGLFGWSPKDDDPVDFTGMPASIDQLMSQNIFGGTPPLNLGIRWSESGKSCSVSAAADGSLISEPGLYPQQAFQQLFSDFELGTDAAARRRSYRQSVVDQVLPHYQAVRDNQRMSSRDRAVLEQHMDHMHTLSNQLSTTVGECTLPENVAFDREPETVNAGAQAQVDIGIAALRCGLTSIVNFYLDPDVLFTDELHGVAGGHHGASHNTDDGAVQSIENAHRWHMRYLSDFLTKLDATATPDGTMLDDSLVFVNNEIGNQAGRSGNQVGDYDANHLGLDIQTMIIGGAGGTLRTGTFMDYRTDFERSRWTQYIGTAYNRLLVSCMLAMGMTPEQWEVDGTPGYGDLRGGLFGQTPTDQVVFGDLRSSLPGLSAS